jgi:hypothetical protein
MDFSNYFPILTTNISVAPSLACLTLRYYRLSSSLIMVPRVNRIVTVREEIMFLTTYVDAHATRHALHRSSHADRSQEVWRLATGDCCVGTA